MNVMRAMFWPVLMSLLGAIYFGYQHDPYIAVIIYSVFCTALYLIKQYRGVLTLFGNAPTKGVGFAMVPSFLLSVITTVFLPFLIAQTVAFYAVRGFIS